MALVHLAHQRLTRGGLTRPLTRRRKLAALAVAGVADVAQLALAPLFAAGGLSPFDDALDVVVALALLVIVGRSWRLVAALALELVPGMALFPTWTALAATLFLAPDAAEAAVPALAPARAAQSSRS